jgi:hypothetical protein
MVHVAALASGLDPLCRHGPNAAVYISKSTKASINYVCVNSIMTRL